MQHCFNAEAAANAARQPKGKVAIAIRCANSRDLEMIPSSQSDFALYGGLYRFVNLVAGRVARTRACLERSAAGGKAIVTIARQAVQSRCAYTAAVIQHARYGPVRGRCASWVNVRSGKLPPAFAQISQV